jgi:hypothetical protein
LHWQFGCFVVSVAQPRTIAGREQVLIRSVAAVDFFSLASALLSPLLSIAHDVQDMHAVSRAKWKAKDRGLVTEYRKSRRLQMLPQMETFIQKWNKNTQKRIGCNPLTVLPCRCSHQNLGRQCELPIATVDGLADTSPCLVFAFL